MPSVEELERSGIGSPTRVFAESWISSKDSVYSPDELRLALQGFVCHFEANIQCSTILAVACSIINSHFDDTKLVVMVDDKGEPEANIVLDDEAFKQMQLMLKGEGFQSERSC